MKIDTKILNKTKCNNMEKRVYTIINEVSLQGNKEVPTCAKQEVTQHINRIKNRYHMIAKHKSLEQC